MSQHVGVVRESSLPSASDYKKPEWIELPFEECRDFRTGDIWAHQREGRTGLWRTMRPVIDYERCSGCWWVCSTYCPDGAINVTDESLPDIDYDHCKGCLVCVAQCPPQAIESIPEHVAKRKFSSEYIQEVCMTRRLLTGNSAAAWGARLAGVDYIPAFPSLRRPKSSKTCRCGSIVARWMHAW